MKRTLLITLSMASFAAFGQVKGLDWQVKKTSWSPQDEKMFQEFVRGIGSAREKPLCGTTDACINLIGEPDVRCARTLKAFACSRTALTFLHPSQFPLDE